MRSSQLQSFAARITRSLIKNSLRAFIGQHQHRSYDLSLDPIIATERLVSMSTHQLHTARREMRHHSSAQELSSGISFEYLTVATDEEDDLENIYDVPTMDDEPKSPLDKASSVAPFATLPVSCSIASVKPLQPSCEIYDYDIYYGKKTDTINTTTTTSSSHNTNSTSSSSKKHYLDTIQRKKTTLYSPRHYHPGGSNLSTGNRPNSRNSLNSRLSSSHNSLSVPTSNKADDSIFITQAMSHDTLTGREISDFYNVPIDSDMYSLPVDVVVVGLPVPPRPPKPLQPQISLGYKNLRSKLKCQRLQKKRRKHCSTSAATDEFTVTTDFKYSAAASGSHSKMKMRTTAEAKRYSVPENSIEPMHMSLDEVKRVYHSLYSSSSDGSVSDVVIIPVSANAKAVSAKKAPPQSSLVSTPSSGGLSGSNHNNNHIVSSPVPENINAKPMPTVVAATKTIGPSPAKKKASKSTGNNTPKSANTKTRNASVRDNELSANNNNNTTTGQSNADKYGCGGKKSQFSINLNLKQKFCSIFRFRRSATAHITSGGASANANSGSSNGAAMVNRGSDEYVHTGRLNGGGGGGDARSSRSGKQTKNQKFSSRALPPLPNKSKLNE